MKYCFKHCYLVRWLLLKLPPLTRYIFDTKWQRQIWWSHLFLLEFVWPSLDPPDFCKVRMEPCSSGGLSPCHCHCWHVLYILSMAGVVNSTHTRCTNGPTSIPQSINSLLDDRLCISPPPALFQLAKRLHLSSCPDWMHCLCKSSRFVRLLLLPLETKASAMDKSYEEGSSLKKQHATKEALQ